MLRREPCNNVRNGSWFRGDRQGRRRRVLVGDDQDLEVVFAFGRDVVIGGRDLRLDTPLTQMIRPDITYFFQILAKPRANDDRCIEAHVDYTYEEAAFRFRFSARPWAASAVSVQMAAACSIPSALTLLFWLLPSGLS